MSLFLFPTPFNFPAFVHIFNTIFRKDIKNLNYENNPKKVLKPNSSPLRLHSELTRESTKHILVIGSPTVSLATPKGVLEVVKRQRFLRSHHLHIQLHGVGCVWMLKEKNRLSDDEGRSKSKGERVSFSKTLISIIHIIVWLFLENFGVSATSCDPCSGWLCHMLI